MRRYIVSGCAIVDRVLPQGDETEVRISLGGGAVYALSGIRLWQKDCCLACYSGSDFDRYYGDWMHRNGLSSAGVIPRFPKTNVCDLYYLPNGTHTMGAGDPDYMRPPGDRPDFELLRPYLETDTENLAIHLVTGYVGDLFEKMSSYRSRGLKLGYEIDPEDPSFPDIIREIPVICEKYVDFFSISYTELQGIFGSMTSIDLAIDYCLSLKCAVFLRAGEAGAYMIQNGTVCHTPMIGRFGNQDPTGCGNSSTAAAFLAFCEGMSPERASVMGGVTASLNAGTKGLIPEITTELQEQCAVIVQEYLTQ